MTTALARYDAACRAIAEAMAVDEAKEIRDQADAMRVYARQANNRDLERQAAEIRIRAERRVGELIIAQKESVGLNRGAASGGKKDSSRGSYTEQRDTRPTLKDVGIDRKLSMTAQKLAAIPADRFETDLDEWRARSARDSGRITTTLIRGTNKKAHRAAREEALSDKIMALPDKRYGLIYADPEWRFETRSERGMDRSADNHYSTSPTETIAMLDVDSISADDCVLFLWATVPMLPDALVVMTAWGFIYKSHYIWNKIYSGKRVGTGYWSRNKHELLLIGVRGDVPCPAPGTQLDSLLDGDVGGHSEKPALFREMIEGYYPTLPKIELNFRDDGQGPPPGWDVWGFEATRPGRNAPRSELRTREATPPSAGKLRKTTTPPSAKEAGAESGSPASAKPKRSTKSRSKGQAA